MKSLLRFFKAPPVWLMLISYFLTIAFASLSMVLVFLEIMDWRAYTAYAFAGVTLAYSVFTIVKFAPKIKAWVLDIIRSNSFSKKLLEEYGFRSLAISVGSLSINIAYTIFNAIIAIITLSPWYGAISLYHAALMVMRSDTLLSRKKNPKSSYTRCAITLLILPIFLSFAILQMVTGDAQTNHIGWTIYAYAAYAFTKITMAIYNLFKAKKENYTIKAVKRISLADALVSILTLQTSLLSTFSNSDSGMANAATGAVVCILTVAVGIFMLIERKRNEQRQ